MNIPTIIGVIPKVNPIEIEIQVNCLGDIKKPAEFGNPWHQENKGAISIAMQTMKK